MTTPLRQPRRLSRDVGSATRRTPSQSGIPRPRSGSHNGPSVTAPQNASKQRLATTQPTYDFLAGDVAESDLFPHGRTSLRQPLVARPDQRNEDLRAQLKALQYELDIYKQEKEVMRLRYEKELRDAQAKADADSKRALTTQKSNSVTVNKFDAMARELKELQDTSVNRQHELEGKLRAAQAEARSSREDLEEIQSEFARLDREYKHKQQDAEKMTSSLERSLDHSTSELNAKSIELRRVQQHLSDKEREFGELESSFLELKTKAMEAGEVAALRNQFSDQVNHVRELEMANQNQLAELKKLRESHRVVGIVEEEKNALARKVQRMEHLESELGEAKFQKKVLEEERKSWSSYLQGSFHNGHGFDSPEEVGRALAEERMERITLAEKLGAVQPLLVEKEELIGGLDKEVKRLKAEMESYRANSVALSSGKSNNDARSRSRLERQKNLAIKEVDYLRAQLRTFENEDSAQDQSEPSDSNEQMQGRVTQLEDLVAEYRTELEALNVANLARDSLKDTELDRAVAKRPLSGEGEGQNEQLGTLSRRNRKLQDELSAAQQRSAMLNRELEASKGQVLSLQELSRTRVLALRRNPTDDFENVKLSQLRTLRTENEGLHALLERKGISDAVPRASLDAKDQELEEWKAKVAEREKRMLRLKQSWAAKALEMRQAIASILGWKVEFAPNGKFKLSSIFYPQGDDDDEDDDFEGGLGNNYLIFDGEKGTVQVSGGPGSEFAHDINGLVKFWVEGRKEIPGLMAACTLEFYERTTRALRG